MEASPAKVIQYFNGEKQNLIPLFQRPYTWKEQNWTTLWSDVMVQYDLGDSSAHFLGAIVSVPARSVPVGVSKYLIIDGQQRLTTISLLLCALRDSLDSNTASRIQEVYMVNKFREPEDTLKFVPTQADREVYRQIVIDRQPPSNGSLMAQAYHFFKQGLATGLDSSGEPIAAAKVLTTLEHCLQVVMINLGDTDDPYLIFESLNFKGEPLTQADLVRNYLLMRFRHSIASGGEQERVYNAYWRPLETKLQSNLTEYLRHYAMKEGENIKQGGIYAATKARLKGLTTSETIEQEMGRILSYGEIYSRLLEPDLEPSEAIRKRLVDLRDLNVTTAYPLLLRLFGVRKDGSLSEEELEKCLWYVESFVVRRAVCSVPTNALNKLFLEWARAFPKGDYAKWLFGIMSNGIRGRRWPDSREFREAFQIQPQYGRGTTWYILCRLEKSFRHKEPVELSTTTIEHVLPQTITSDWKNELGSEAERVHARLLDTFGNLTLTGYNTELGNLPFAIKKEKLQNTHIELNRWILEQSNWREPEILRRALTLFEVAKKLWTGPTDPLTEVL